MSEKAQFISKIIEDYRKRLLDTTRRNNLIAFRHSDRSRNHVRIVNELPDVVYRQLCDEKVLIFNALPDIDIYMSDKFIERFERAKLFDEDYIKARANASLTKIKQADYTLRNKIREEFNLVLLDDYETPSNSEIAQQNNINPSYEMPTPDEYIEYGGHKYIQTLLLPSEMDRKLSGLYSIINNDTNESGVNTLFLAFGFLQWYEHETSKPCYSPLMLLRLDMEKKQSKGGYVYSIKSTGDEPEVNLPLIERLRSDFGLTLPAIEGSDTPESYMDKINGSLKHARTLPQKNNWAVKRFITVGRFHFARLVMYHDLGIKSEKTLISNTIIEKLLYGTNEETSLVAKDYDVDKPEIEQLVPLLITDVDASQHSAIVDAMKGKNLVIKGPPGTGKSQTITNIIANALYSGKKVLFLAEKMAALNVVYDRLNKANLGRYCIELHSNKAKRTEIIESIKNRLHPIDLNKRQIANDFVGKRAYLLQYVNILNATFGKQNKSVHDYLWAMQYSRTFFNDMPEVIKQFNISFAQANMDANGYNKGKEYLKNLAALRSKISFQGNYPWHFICNYTLNPFEQSELIRVADRWLNNIKSLITELKHHDIGNSNYSFNDVADYLKGCKKLFNNDPSLLNIDLLALINDREKTELFVKYADECARFSNAINTITVIENPSAHIDNINTIEKCINLAKTFQFQKLDESALANEYDKANEYVDSATAVRTQLNLLRDYFNLSGNDSFSIIQEIIALQDLIKNESAEIWKYRTPRMIELIDANTSNLLYEALQKQNNIKTIQRDLDSKLNLSLLGNLEEIKQDVRVIASGGLLSSIFNSRYKQAKQIYKAACINNHKFSKHNALTNLGNYISLLEDSVHLNEDKQLIEFCGKFFNGIKTNFGQLFKLFSVVHNLASNLQLWLLNVPIDKIETFQNTNIDALNNFLQRNVHLVKKATTVDKILNKINEYIENTIHKKEQINILCQELTRLGAISFESVEKEFNHLVEAAASSKEIKKNPFKDISLETISINSLTIEYLRHKLFFGLNHYIYKNIVVYEKWEAFSRMSRKLNDLYEQATNINNTEFEALSWQTATLSGLHNKLEYALEHSNRYIPSN